MEATSKLEAMLSRIGGIKNISSSSGRGGGHISIDFDKNVDIDAARFEVSTAVRQTKPFLPPSVSYPYVSQSRSSSDGARPFLTYTVNAPSMPIVIQQYVENSIKPKLAKIEGVSMVSVSGATPMEWRLEYDHRQLESLGISPRDIQSAISSYLSRGMLGTAWTEGRDGQLEWVRVAFAPDETYEDIADFLKLKVAKKEGQLIPLEQLVTITHREQDPYGFYRINGLNSITLEISAEENSNQLELGSEVKARIRELEQFFPQGYEIHLQYDATEYIDDELNKVYYRSGLTLVILLLFVLLIYRNLKYLLLISVSLVINIATAVIFYWLGRMEIQLYSLAGITISLTLVIDNTIVMSDQILHRRNRRAFPAILAATLTTIASLVIIFFLEERLRLNLLDFAKVIMVNLAVSLLVALFLVPALIDKLEMEKTGKRVKGKGFRVEGKRLRIRGFPYTFHLSPFSPLVSFNRFYAAFCRFTWRWRVPICIFIVLAFGLPVYLFPEKVQGENSWAEAYNKTLGSTFYKEKIKPVTDVCLGGSMRLFAKKVQEGGYYNYSGGDREETMLYVTATLPNGSTLDQMNMLVQKMESFISEHNDIRLFITNVSPRRASISIYFSKASARSGFPYMMKNAVIRKASQLGGGSWAVSGFGEGFNNDVREGAGNYRINLYGYNYDELQEHAFEFKKILLGHRRINDVLINSQFSYYKDDYEEFIFRLNTSRMADENIRPSELASSAASLFQRPVAVGMVAGEFGDEQIKLVSRRAADYDIWSLRNFPGRASGDKEFKLGDLAEIERTQAPQDIVKENQQYKLCIQYEYVGSWEQGRTSMRRDIKEFSEKLPMGYSIEEDGSGRWWWDDGESHQYGLLFLIFAIIYFMCSILFNSLRLPFSVIFVIPISFIGIFLTFYLFKLRFDEGGFASFILLCGLSVNANIYVMNEYNNIRQKRPRIEPLRAYIKAWNAKISPIFLTVVSTVLGFIPFMVGHRESFWFPLAAGTVGGLVMSLVGLFCFLPLFMGVGRYDCGTNRISKSRSSGR
jgi:multidrug efflux pump subunit AcrB